MVLRSNDLKNWIGDNNGDKIVLKYRLDYNIILSAQYIYRRRNLSLIVNLVVLLFCDLNSNRRKRIIKVMVYIITDE